MVLLVAAVGMHQLPEARLPADAELWSVGCGCKKHDACDTVAVFEMSHASQLCS